jgi:hypothetical protein
MLIRSGVHGRTVKSFFFGSSIGANVPSGPDLRACDLTAEKVRKFSVRGEMQAPVSATLVGLALRQIRAPKLDKEPR